MTYHELLSPLYTNASVALLYHRAATEAAQRDSISTVSFLGAYCGNGGNFAAAVSAAFCSFGGAHGPFDALVDIWAPLLQSDTEDTRLEDRLESWVSKQMEIPHFRLPGFGNSFHRGEPDPVWLNFQEQLPRKILNLIDAMMRGTQKPARPRLLYPNTSTFTLLWAAACCHRLSEKSLRIAAWKIFLSSRIHAYAGMIENAEQE